MKAFAWNDETVETLKRAMDSGLSASETSRLFSRTYHNPPSRNAILGKAFRMGLTFGDRNSPRVPLANRVHFPWTQEANDLLASLINDARTIPWIIDEFQRKFPTAPRLTPRAVESQGKRLGLTFKKFLRNPATRPSSPACEPASGWKAAPPNLPPATLSEKAVSFFQLEAYMCRWPLGDPADLDTFRFCGDAKMPGRAYCRCHWSLSLDKTAMARSKEGRAILRELADA